MVLQNGYKIILLFSSGFKPGAPDGFSACVRRGFGWNENSLRIFAL